MRAVIQRVSRAQVTVDGEIVGTIAKGFVALIGVETNDTNDDAAYISEKIASLRVFEDAAGKMNLSLADVGGAVLAISQFTLAGDCRQGRRPSFTTAARPETAEPLYELVVSNLRSKGLTVATGRFRTHMDVELINDGPITLLVDSRRQF